MSPTSPPAACLEPRCPDGAAERGYCARHRRTTTQRGYGIGHQRERTAALPGARCEACGCNRNLQRDHRIPTTLGGDEHPGNKRWLCRCPEHGCHDRLGLKSSTRSGGGGVATGSECAPSLTRAAILVGSQVSRIWSRARYGAARWPTGRHGCPTCRDE